MTETPKESKRGTSIEALRQRVSAVEGRFSRIDHENTDYRQRLRDLMATVEEDQKERRDEIELLEKRIESVASENEQLREILDGLLTSAETFGEGQLDEPLADLDARVRGQAWSKDLIGEAAARIGEARNAADDKDDGGEAKDEAETEGDAKADDEADPAEKPSDEIEAEAVDGEIVVEEPDLAPGPDAVELAANEASGEDVLELEAQVVDVEVETISPAEAKDDKPSAPTPPPSKPQSDAEPEKKPEAAATVDKKKEAVEESKAAKITTDKETDQLDRILASIRRITSAL